MALIDYDVSNVSAVSPLRPALKRRSGRPPGTEPAAEAGSFAARVTSRQVNLVEIIDKGLPPIEFLPASDGMLVRGKRHLVSAPAKEGKSLGMLVQWVDMALAGATVALLDRENGQDIYARRLRDVLEARSLSAADRALVGAALRYFDFPTLKRGDAEALVAGLADVDLVVLDAQRMFLTDLGFGESEADDYAAFMADLIDPLFRAGIATLILDNTGHKEKTRARGASAKGDLNEVLFSIKTTAEFDLYRTGSMTLKVERSRFGNTGQWTLDLGGGAFGSWGAGTAAGERHDFEAAVVAALKEAGRPLGQDKLIESVRKAGVSVGTDNARALLGRYAENADSPVIKVPKGYALAKEGR